jgi:hypothetical protein
MKQCKKLRNLVSGKVLPYQWLTFFCVFGEIPVWGGFWGVENLYIQISFTAYLAEILSKNITHNNTIIVIYQQHTEITWLFL